MLRPSIIALALATLLPLTATSATEKSTTILAGPDANSLRRAQPCSTHARLMRRACEADRTDDYLVHLADCYYVTSEAEQGACRSEARAEREEKGEECTEVFEARLEVCQLVGEQRFDLEFDPLEIVDPNEIGISIAPNPYWPLTAGHTSVILGDEEIAIVAVTDEVIEVGGLPCRVVRDLVFEVDTDERGAVEYEAIEVTQDWYAQHINGDTIYCGENTYEIEDGLIDNTDGSFANGTERARAGFLVRAVPVIGAGDRQEMASDEAEDYVRYESLAAAPSKAEGGDSGAFPCNNSCLKTFEVNPHDPGEAEHKYYIPDTGFVLATKLEDGEPTGEREEVSCIGASLKVLNEPGCGVADPEALFEQLCVWAPEAFCGDDD